MTRARRAIVALALLLHATARAADPPPPPFHFTRLVAHWDQYAHPDYLPFIADARPQVVQLGFYGVHFYSLAHTPHGKGYPAHFPVVGLKEQGAWFAERNAAVHKLGAKVVGHFNVEFLVGDPDTPAGPTGFFKFYRDLWDEAELGPRPVADPLDLLEKNADGTPISQKGYAIGGMKEYWACLRNPHWRAVLKAWVKAGINRGVDGFVANYFYRHNCFCNHCQTSFRDHLKRNFTPAQLAEKFNITDVDRHAFAELPVCHDPKTTTPLKLETLRWGQISNKAAFDDVFIAFGRKLKPDLIVAQWNHLGDFNQISGDERCLLPAGLWGRDETYTWYSTGDAANATDLANGHLGEATLQARYVRGAMRGRPYTLGKYEQTRIRTAIAELAANGGAPMGFYTRFTDPAARAEIVRYYNFLEKHDALYANNQPAGEVALLFPRSAVHKGDTAAVAAFKAKGRALLDQHVLFDVLPDDAATPQQLAAYKHVLKHDAADPPLADVSTFAAPATVRVSASRAPATGKDLTLHFVNYNRTEPPKTKDGKPSPGRGIADEQPLPAKPIEVRLRLPANARVSHVETMTPEHPTPQRVAATATDNHLTFTLPESPVYRIARVVHQPP